MIAYSDPLVTLYQGDALDVLACLEPESVQCVVTSPPYWGLRLYEYDGAAEGFGNEKLHDCLGWARGERCARCYVCHSLAFLDAIRRVLRRDGVVFWNIASSYQDKQDALIPQRVALAAQAAGWWVRSDIIWAKPNPMPESTTDRPTRSYEHILMLTKSARYHWDAEAVREPARDWGTRDRSNMRNGTTDPKLKHYGLTNGNNAELGRNIRDVWNMWTPATYRPT